MTRKIPASGINLFQLIYQLRREYEERSGQKPLNLSLGNPDGIPPEAVRELQARYAADPGFDYHTYAEDGNLHRFAEGMVALHGGIDVDAYPGVRALPIAGIKTAGALMPLACGLHLLHGDGRPDAERRRGFKLVSNLPAYDVIGTWTQGYLGAERIVWPLGSDDDMRLNMARLDAATKEPAIDLVYVIRPGNPAAVGASEDEWNALLDWCKARGARLVNDGAYAGLCEPGRHVSLASVACTRDDVEWIEMYSVSKSFSDPGARLGALVGSRDFVDDFVLIKGNTDSGPVPFVMAAYGDFLADTKGAQAALDAQRAVYRERLDYVIGKLREAGLRQACETSAGFFTLWKVPHEVLGVVLKADPRTRDLPAHEAFNRLVIEHTGIVGVHFEAPGTEGRAEPLIRYAVCDDVLAPAFRQRFEQGLARLEPKY